MIKSVRTRKRGIGTGLLVLLLSLIANCLIWDVGEVKLLELGSAAIRIVTGAPVIQAGGEDSQGIPVQIYREHGTVYNPLFIARDAQSAAGSSAPEAGKDFISYSDWLYRHATENDSLLLVSYRFDYPELGMRDPWTSALAQAVIMNVFLLRYEASGDSLWQIRSRKALKSLDPASGTGLASRGGDGVWFWEYPSKDSIRVLNGMMGILLELDRYGRATGNELAKSLFKDGFAALRRELPAFDRHGYSLYDSRGVLAGRMYHQKHISQLKALNSINPDPVLARYAKRWQVHDHLPLPWQLILNPRPKRVLAFGFTWLILILLGFLVLNLLRRRFRQN